MAAVVARYPSRPQAELARARLEAAGIVSALHTDDAGGLFPNLASQGIRLVVADADLDRSQRVLGEPAPLPGDDRTGPTPGAALVGKALLVVAVVALVLSVLRVLVL